MLAETVSPIPRVFFSPKKKIINKVKCGRISVSVLDFQKGTTQRENQSSAGVQGRSRGRTAEEVPFGQLAESRVFLPMGNLLSAMMPSSLLL